MPEPVEAVEYLESMAVSLGQFQRDLAFCGGIGALGIAGQEAF